MEDFIPESTNVYYLMLTYLQSSESTLYSLNHKKKITIEHMNYILRKTQIHPRFIVKYLQEAQSLKHVFDISNNFSDIILVLRDISNYDHNQMDKILQQQLDVELRLLNEKTKKYVNDIIVATKKCPI